MIDSKLKERWDSLKPVFTVDLIEQDDKHFYSVNGSRTLFPGATTVLNVVSKVFLIQWSAKVAGLYVQKILLKVFKLFLQGKKSKKVHNYIRFIELLMLRCKKQHKIMKEDAGNLGSRAHKAIDDLIKGREPLIADDIKPCVDGFKDWLAKTHLRLVCGDIKVASPEDGYGGSLDGVAVDINERFVVLEFKTSNQISDTFAYQGASYAIALKRMFSLPYTPDVYIFRFDKKKAKVEIKKVADVILSFNGFMHCLGLYKDLQRDQFSEREILKAV
jgi:hypothetical protein